MIVPDNIIGQLIRFNVNDKVGRPVLIKQTPYHEVKTERYNDTLLLVTENQTPDHPFGQDETKQFNEVEFLGFLPSRLDNALTTSTRQMADRIYVMADRIYVVTLPTDGADIAVAGESSRFLWQDVTEDLDEMIYGKQERLREEI
ncbi:Core trichothecene cluster (CTC) protein 14 [Fusarium equiseti]|uniref:Core trichothecene cluster (CTC) protein 14 n=1 Tax=Fusarium equiseti TaxID=61235 RepID=A0ABQ8R7K2_FUSEQ|nr:Core trichothecene cluster (CTC) protein 14 [Fusarium equiseti]